MKIHTTNKCRISESKLKLLWDLGELYLSDFYKTKDFDVAIHLAAQTQVKDALNDPVQTFESNIKGTWNILENSRIFNKSISEMVYLTKFFNEINEYIDLEFDERRLGDLIRDSKNNSSSEHLFHLFGDPALPLPFPFLLFL